MKHSLTKAFLFGVCLCTACTDSSLLQVQVPTVSDEFRAPAYPLITIDPYTSVWSFADRLTDEPTKHWTGVEQSLIGAIRVDGKTYRFMGKEGLPLETVLPMASKEHWEAAYTEEEPAKDWFKKEFDDKKWNKGKASFGTEGQPDLATRWDSKDIWVRRTFTLDEDLKEPAYLEFSHDDIFELYINGIQVVATDYVWRNNVVEKLPKEVVETLKAGENVIAAHCHNRVGGGLVDFGLKKAISDEAIFVETARQKSAIVHPTQTYYTFECGGVDLDVVFTAPLLMDDLYQMTMPVNYMTYQVKANDGKEHDVQVYVETTSELAVDRNAQEVVLEQFSKNNITYLKAGTTEQPILKKKGDNVRIDWGYLYLATANGEPMRIAEYADAKKVFSKTGTIETVESQNTPLKSTAERMNAMACSYNFGKVTDKAVSNYIMIGYDDLYSVQYFGENLRPYWSKNGTVTITDEFESAAKNYVSLMKKCARFDKKMLADARKSGSDKYATLCALAYRQAIAAHKLVADRDGNLLFLSKENFSNGSIGTVDVTYPSAPLFLIYNPNLLKGMLNPIFYYSESGKWTKPFAAHDVGTYPQANGQTYGGDMPVEESGNMLILTAAIANAEGSTAYAAQHWDVLTTWADYLAKEGLDPENQLCTDDFAGHFAHNTNLSIKAIMGVASYAILAEAMGDLTTAEKYLNKAKTMAQEWKKMADDGDHYRLTFDQSGTWSQKYNMVWDKIFKTDLFPSEIATKEIAYYLTKQNKYGLPLDNRKTYTKSDWIIWTASMTSSKKEFDAFVDLIYKYADETTTRMPLSDWHETTDGKSVGFRARSVVGGYFMKMFVDKTLSK